MKVRPFHHQRPLAAIAAAYGAGIGAGARLPWHPAVYTAGFAVCLIAAALLPRIGRRRIIGVMGAMLCLGVLASGAALHPALPPEGKYTVTGVLTADMTLREDGTAAGYLTGVTLSGPEGEERLSKVYWTYRPREETEALPREGDQVRFEGTLYHPRGQENPYGFDFRMFLMQHGAAAGVSGNGDLTVDGHPGRGAASLLYRARQAVIRRLDAVFGAGSDLAKALLIGEKNDLPRETVRGFTDAGAAHILTVSGLHVALLAAVLMLPLRRLLSPRARFGVLAGFLLLYSAVLDFPAPVVRASVLLLIAGVRRLVRRAGDRLTALSAAFLLILLFRPLDLFSAGFQLSFCAVLGIELILPWMERKWPRIPREYAGVSLAATLGAALPTAQIFHRLSLIGLFINPLVCALFGVLIPAYLAVFAVGCVWLQAGQWLGAPLGMASAWITEAVKAAGNLPFATVRVPALPWYCVIALVCAALLATRYTVWPGKRKAAAAALILCAAFGVWRLTVCRDVRYVQLSVGQADSALILDGPETAVIDAGDYGGDTAAFLLSEGRKADRLILTHLHMDHCGGLRQLMDERVPIGAVYLPEGAEEQEADGQALSLLEELRGMGVPIEHLAAGDEIRTGRTEMTVLWPEHGRVRPGQDANRYSMTMLWDLDGVKLLYCSDMPGEYEGYAARDADILKVAHHGSKSSTLSGFLETVEARIAIVSASGRDVRLPHPDTLERLAAAGAKTFITGKTGAVSVRCRKGNAQITTFLEELQ